jgi:hypothetical protein
MVSPLSAFHCQTRSRNLARPCRAGRLLPFHHCRSTTIWVAMPAWSVPGCHTVAAACVEAAENVLQRVVQRVAICSEPVTFGAGSRW